MKAMKREIVEIELRYIKGRFNGDMRDGRSSACVRSSYFHHDIRVLAVIASRYFSLFFSVY